jgi:hypothetical protein
MMENDGDGQGRILICNKFSTLSTAKKTSFSLDVSSATSQLRHYHNEMVLIFHKMISSTMYRTPGHMHVSSTSPTIQGNTRIGQR